MIVLVLLLLLAVAVVAGTGVLAYQQQWSLPGGGPRAWGAVAADRVGAVPAAVGLAGVGSIGAWLATVPIGYLAKALEGAVDKPAFRYAQAHVHAGSKFTALNTKLTVLGNNSEIQLLGLIAVLLLAFAYKRRWWIPTSAVVAVFYIERYAQHGLARLADRGHPPTSLGTFPSGGVARIVSVYGTILVLALVVFPAASRAWRAGLFTAVGVAATVEAYTRYYLSKHWLTDTVGALVFGYLLLAVAAAVVAALTTNQLPAASNKAHPSNAVGATTV